MSDCPECHGAGASTVPRRTWDADRQRFAHRMTTGTCETCEGGGDVEPCGTCRRSACVCDQIHEQRSDR